MELAAQLLKIRTSTIQANKEFEDHENWTRFTGCTEKTDPNDEKEITQQLSRFQELKIEEKLEVAPLIKACQNAEDLNNQLLIMHEKASVENDTKKIESSYRLSFRRCLEHINTSVSARAS